MPERVGKESKMPLQKRKKIITDISTEEKYLRQFSIHKIVQLDVLLHCLIVSIILFNDLFLPAF